MTFHDVCSLNVLPYGRPQTALGAVNLKYCEQSPDIRAVYPSKMARKAVVYECETINHYYKTRYGPLHGGVAISCTCTHTHTHTHIMTPWKLAL